MRFTKTLLVCAAVGATCLMGCNNNKKTAEAPAAGAMTMANTKCPYSGEPINPKVTSTYNGKQVGFCCAGCKGKFDKATDAQKAEMMAKAK